MNHELSLEEQEKLDQIKSLWQQYGNLILGALLAALATFVAVQWWQQANHRKTAEAASLYASLQGMQQAGQSRAVTTLADTLVTRYPDSPYATRGALIAAASNLTSHQTDLASKELQWVLDHSQETPMRSLAGLRLAEIELDQHQADKALKLLDTPHDEHDANLYNDLKGDAYVMLDQREQARAAYRIALEKLPADSPYRQVIEIKLNAIAGVANK